MKPVATWSYEVTCLLFKDQAQVPDANERIKLALMDLSNNLLMSGDSFLIHEQILKAFPALKDCVGYNRSITTIQKVYSYLYRATTRWIHSEVSG